MRRINHLLVVGLASAVALPDCAVAQITREATLETRLERLEAAVGELRGELDRERAAHRAADDRLAEIAAAQANGDTTVAATDAKLAATDAKVAKLEARPAPLVEGFRDGKSTIKLGGWIKTIANFTTFGGGQVAANSTGRDFYIPSTTPIGGVRSHVTDFSAKQSRVWLNAQTDVAGHILKGYAEADFQVSPGAQGTQRTTNGYDLALRRVYLQFDHLLVGQDWSTFQYTPALPETTDLIGPTEGTVFVRQPQIRYTATLGKHVALAVSAENPETASASVGAPALIENDDDHIPDFVARLTYADRFGEVSLAGLARQVSTVNGTQHANGDGFGVSGAGKINLDVAKTADLRFMATYGRGIDRYVGLNFAPDGILVPGSNDLRDVTVFAAFTTLHLPLADRLRLNVTGSYQNVGYPDGFVPTAFLTFNKQSWSGSANLFFTPVANLDFGVEYRHGRRKIVSDATGTIDRLEFAAKYGF